MGFTNGLLKEVSVYLAHCLAVFRQGYSPPLFESPQSFDGDLSGADDEHLTLVIEEGRRQLDRQLNDLERIRSRSGILVTVGIAEIGLLTAGVRPIFEAMSWTFALWILSAASVVLGLLGAIAVLTVAAQLGRLDTRLIANMNSAFRCKVAEGYADCAGLGEATIATRLTIFRLAVLMLVLGAMAYATSWAFTL